MCVLIFLCVGPTKKIIQNCDFLPKNKFKIASIGFRWSQTRLISGRMFNNQDGVVWGCGGGGSGAWGESRDQERREKSAKKRERERVNERKRGSSVVEIFGGIIGIAQISLKV